MNRFMRRLIQREAAVALKYSDLVLRRFHTVESSGDLTDDLVVSQDAPQGATELVLSADSGSVPFGLLVTLGGGQYLVTASAEVSEGAVAVQLDPPLLSPVVSGATATLARASVVTAGRIGVGSQRQELASEGGALYVDTDETVLLEPREVPSGWSPRAGDRIEHPDGSLLGVVSGLGDPKGPVLWRCVLEGGAS